jgi:hypothetical protein
MPRRRSSFGTSFDNSFKGFSDAVLKKEKSNQGDYVDTPYQFVPPGRQDDYSEVRFYDFDSTWSRWRRGYELYCITQQYLASSATGRNTRGDFRMFFTFQFFPGLFVPVRIFTFPSAGNEEGEHTVGIRDANSLNLYDLGLPIDSVRYVTAATAGTYNKSGTTVVVTSVNHGLRVGESAFLDYTSGTAVDETLVITSTTDDTFTCTSAASVTTAGTVNIRQEFADTAEGFADTRWTEQRVKIRSMPTPVTLLAGERLVDRVVERDSGLNSTYSQSGNIVTVTCSSPHGLSTGNQVFLKVTSGNTKTGLYKIIVTSTTEFTAESIISATASGNVKVQRRIKGFDFNNYVGNTVTGVDLTTDEILFKRDESYGVEVVNNKPKTVTPAPRGFLAAQDRFLTTEVRYQCSCSDFMRRRKYNLYKDTTDNRFPTTGIESVIPGTRQDREGNVIDSRDNPGVFSDFGYSPTGNFYEVPEYNDDPEGSFGGLLYYQTRWCKHIYAALFSMKHDEGNDKFSFEGRYQQSGPNVNITIVNHGLSINKKVAIDFTSGDLLDGQYTISAVPDENTITIVYPFSGTTQGDCTVSNLKIHEYVNVWLLEPSDQPAGNALDKFYKNFEKEQDRTRKAAERMALLGYGLPWTGNKDIEFGQRNEPEEVAQFDPTLVTMKLTDTIRRDGSELNRDGKILNNAATTLMSMQKVLNLDFKLIEDVRIGLLNQPLTDFTPDFQFGEVEGGTYLNGEPITGAGVSSMDCSTYNPGIEQSIDVDAGLYIN